VALFEQLAACRALGKVFVPPPKGNVEFVIQSVACVIAALAVSYPMIAFLPQAIETDGGHNLRCWYLYCGILISMATICSEFGL
jgi:hypothetical protein